MTTKWIGAGVGLIVCAAALVRAQEARVPDTRTGFSRFQAPELSPT